MKKTEKTIIYIFISALVVIYSAVLISDFVLDEEWTVVKYVGILSCVAFAAYSVGRGKSGALTVLLGLTFTAFADYFLLVEDNLYEVGVSSFIVAQLLYLILIMREKGKISVVSVSVRVALFAVFSVVIIFLEVGEPLLFLVAAYASIFAVNAVEAVTLAKSGVKRSLFAIGLALFVCCDVCVLLFNLGAFVDVGYGYDVAVNFVKLSWTFYLPSQVLISLSTAF